MKAPIIVNESTAPTDPGCVYVFSSLALAERYFESWYADESYFACDANGLPLKIVARKQSDGVSIVEASEEPARPDLAASFLRSYLKSIVHERKVEGSDVSEQWLASASTQDIAEASLRYATE
jgi:hypothetical protein